MNIDAYVCIRTALHSNEGRLDTVKRYNINAEKCALGI